MTEDQARIRKSMLERLMALEKMNDDIAETPVRHRISNCIIAARRELAEEPHSREVRAEMLLRDMFMKCRDSHRMNQHNPYSWAELNKDLMHRLKEFM